MKRAFVLFACLAMLQVVAGCGEKPAAKKDSGKPENTDKSNNTGKSVTEDDHHHGDAPHGGTIADWGGGKYHVEFTVDHDKKEAAVYVLGSDGKSPAPIKAESIQLTINDPMTEMELVAKPLEGEAEGTSSRFVGTHDSIGIVKEFAGTISGQIEDTPYTGDFKEVPHDHEQ